MRFLILLLLSGASLAQAGDPNGLVPGRTTYVDMIAELGSPDRVEHTINGVNYHYDGVQINFSCPESRVINTISFLRSGLFNLVEGIDVGSYQVEARATIARISGDESFMIDLDRRTAYWIQNGVVSRIVVARPGAMKGTE